MSVLLQAERIQKGGLQGRGCPWGRPKKKKKRWFYIALLPGYELDDYTIYRYIPLTIAAHTMRVMKSLCYCSCALRWLCRGLCAGSLLVPYLAQLVFWISLNVYTLDLDYSVGESCRSNPRIADYAGDQCTQTKFVTPRINFSEAHISQ